jgi:allantoinase
LSEHIFDLAVTGNILFGESIVKNGTVLVDGEMISGVIHKDEGFRAKNHIHAEDKWVLPGAIDSHVHSLSYPGEGFLYSTRSACAGGVTTIIDMPVDAPEGIALPEALRNKIAIVEKESFVDVALLGSVKNDTLSHIPALKKEGACGFKLSMFDTDPDRFPRVNDGNLLNAFSIIKETGLTAGVHAENDEIIKALIERYIDEGRTYPRAHCETRPEVSETESVLRGLEVARATGVRFHLYHISCSRSVDLANYYREEGYPVTLETCPHYLVFSEEDMDRLGGRLRINPPVRKKPESDNLWRGLKDGRIDTVASDHAPWPVEQKDRPSIFENSCGAPGVETLLPILFSEGVVKNRISMTDLSRVLMENPARIFGLFPKKGMLAPGSDADIIVFHPQKRWTVKGKDLHTSAKWTPYEGMEILGKVETTIVRGRIVFHEGNVVGEKGYGKFVRP